MTITTMMILIVCGIVVNMTSALFGIVIFSSLLTASFSMRLRNKLSPELTTKLLGLILLVIACYMGVCFL